MRRFGFALLTLLCLLAIAASLWMLSRSRTTQLFGTLVTHVETNKQMVALTLDDGPNPKGTEATLAILDSVNVKATFFVTGGDLERHMAYGKRIVAAGHSLGNHSFTHSQMVLRPLSFMREEIEKTDVLIREAGWQGPIPFRPPYGRRLFVLPWYLKQNNRETYLWDIEPESYPEIAQDAHAMADYVAERVRAGSIILMHTMFESRKVSREAIPLIVDRVRAKGYKFVTLQELVKEGR